MAWLTTGAAATGRFFQRQAAGCHPLPQPKAPTCGSASSSVHASSTTPGAAKQAKLSMWPAGPCNRAGDSEAGRARETKAAARLRQGHCEHKVVFTVQRYTRTVCVIITIQALWQPDYFLQMGGSAVRCQAAHVACALHRSGVGCDAALALGCLAAARTCTPSMRRSQPSISCRLSCGLRLWFRRHSSAGQGWE